MTEKVIPLFGNDDPRINSLLKELKEIIYRRGVGVFQVATIIGILRMLEHEIIKEAEEHA